MSDWPVCTKCEKSILKHRLHGFRAYCGSSFGVNNMATFTVTEINTVRRALGHAISDTAQIKERREGFSH
jgi:hypothetical protein